MNVCYSRCGSGYKADVSWHLQVYGQARNVLHGHSDVICNLLSHELP
jgi:hypothetical protein